MKRICGKAFVRISRCVHSSEKKRCKLIIFREKMVTSLVKHEAQQRVSFKSCANWSECAPSEGIQVKKRKLNCVDQYKTHAHLIYTTGHETEIPVLKFRSLKTR